MGFGGGGGSSGSGMAAQNSSLMQMFASSVDSLQNQQAAYHSSVTAQDASLLAQMQLETQKMLGHSVGARKKAVNLSLMDFVKTGPQGLANEPVNKGVMGLV